MPGVASLQASRYYAHPRNAFWQIIESLFEIPADADYEQRLDQLLARRVAVWDVLQKCHRRGSLDADIRPSSEKPNDFAAFFANHPDLHTIFFNGRKAEQVFQRKALPAMLRQNPRLRSRVDQTAFLALPSTSPAMASLRFADKLEQWQAVAQAAGSSQRL